MINMILDDANDRMQKAIEAYQRDLATVRTGRATPAMLDRVMVNYYGSPTPINQMAGVSVVEGRQLVIKPYDKSVLKDIEHGIYEADLGLTPQNDGEIIRITVPALTEERRKEFAKNVWKFAEHAKVAVRNIRRDANDEIKKGQPIMKVDLNLMKENNLELYTPLVVLNHDSHPFKDIHTEDNIEVGDDLIQLD